MSLKEILKKEIEREQNMMYGKDKESEAEEDDISSQYQKSPPKRSETASNHRRQKSSKSRNRPEQYEIDKYATRNIDIENQQFVEIVGDETIDDSEDDAMLIRPSNESRIYRKDFTQQNRQQNQRNYQPKYQEPSVVHEIKPKLVIDDKGMLLYVYKSQNGDCWFEYTPLNKNINGSKFSYLANSVRIDSMQDE